MNHILKIYAKDSFKFISVNYAALERMSEQKKKKCELKSMESEFIAMDDDETYAQCYIEFALNM